MLVIYVTTPTPAPIEAPKEWQLDESITETQEDGKIVWRYETAMEMRYVRFFLNFAYLTKSIVSFQIY